MADTSANHTSSANITPINVTSLDNDLIDVANTTQNEKILLGEEEEVISLREHVDEDLCNYINNTIISTGNQDHSLYNWIADSASTSHICNKQEVFIEYTSIKDEIPIYRVGNITTNGIGRGKVIIQAIHNGKTHKIIPNNVLHVQITTIIFYHWDNEHMLVVTSSGPISKNQHFLFHLIQSYYILFLLC